MTLRGRLTLWYTAVLSGVLVFFGAAVYLLLSYSLTSQIEDNLKDTADEILLASGNEVRTITNVYVQVWGYEPGGGPVLLDTNLPGFTQPFESDLMQVEARTFGTVVLGDVRLRVLSVPVVVVPTGESVGYLQIASPLDTVEQARRMLLLVLIGGGATAIAIAAVVGWATAGTALRPLERVTETAMRISRADDLSSRIPLTGPPAGEVGRLTTAFNETMERLERIFEVQRRFLADVSHELRTPLTIIRGNVDLVRRMGRLDDESLEAVTSEVDRMTRMVQDLVVLARAESGTLPLADEVVELDTLMLEVYKEAKVLARDSVGVRLGQEDQARVRGDRDRLKQVLLNLIANAVAHTPAGGEVRLGLDCDKEWARLTVADTGAGIPEEELPHIFERFYRSDPARKRSGGSGAGLGLSIAHWIVRSHGGRMEVVSREGEGSTFSVYLPLMDGDCEREEGAEGEEI